MQHMKYMLLANQKAPVADVVFYYSTLLPFYFKRMPEIAKRRKFNKV